MTETLTTIAALAGRLAALPGGRRHLVALVGAPGAGKSHVSQRLAEAVNAARPGRAEVLQMDGFHYDDRLLDRLGRRARKGAPDTFDVGGLAALLGRLRAGGETVVAPVFDREIEIARAGVQPIPPEAEVIVVEGNYLLLRDAPWDALAPLFDLSVRIDVDEAVLRDRLMARWRGLGLSQNEAAAKVEGNDLPNGRRLLERSLPPDIALRLAGPAGA